MPTPPAGKKAGGGGGSAFALRRGKPPVPFPGSISFDALNCGSPPDAAGAAGGASSPAFALRRPLGEVGAARGNGGRRLCNPEAPAKAGGRAAAARPPSPRACGSGSGSRYVDDFDQLEQIGEGSFGTVFKARKRVDGCLYAVKVTRRQMRSEAQRQEMLREVFALAAVSQSALRRECTHIVRYFNAWWEDGRLFIQTELCDHSLADVIERAGGQPLPNGVCVAVLEQMSLGLSLIHAQDMCHLDVKPANIFVTRGGSGGGSGGSGEGEPVYKLGDLGLATLDQHGVDEVIEGDSKYLPRELLREDFGHLQMADVYSLGATVLEMALGRPLPGAGDEWQRIRDGHLPLDELASASDDLKAVLRWMLQPEPLERPTAAELLRHPLFRTEVELLLHQERAHSSGLQARLLHAEKLHRVLRAKSHVCALKRSETF
jgi:serine/threonine protein kinase